MKNILSNSTGYVVVGLVVAAGAYYLLSESEPNSSLYNRQIPTVTSASPNLPGPRSVSSEPSAPTISDQSQTEERLEKFEKNFKQEAEAVDSLNINAEGKEAELQRWVSTFTPVEMDALLQKAKFEGSSANDRILATYLLTLTGNRSYLKELVKQPIKDREGKVHSMDEVLNTQDRAQAIMSIDKLLESQKPEDLVELQQLAHEITDPVVKKYLHSKLNELSGL